MTVPRDNTIVQILPLIFLAVAITVSPSIPAGAVGPVGRSIALEIRAEDILIAILGLAWAANFLISGKRNIKKPPLFLPIMVWVGIGLVSVLTNWIFGTLDPSRGFFYLLKEIEFFFIYFYVFSRIRNIDSAKFIIRILVVLGLMNVAWVIYQLAISSGFETAIGFRSGEYGASALGEFGVFPTGAFFLLFFVFLFNIFLYYFADLHISKFKKAALGLAAVSPVLGIFGSTSRASFLGMIFALFLTVVLLLWKKRSVKFFAISVSSVIFLIGIFIFASGIVPYFKDRVESVSSPAKVLSSYQESRLENVIEPNLELAFEGPMRLPLIGLGVGYVGEAHNQYLQNFIETGLVGLASFLILIFIILKKSFRGFLGSVEMFPAGLAAGLFVATSTMMLIATSTESFTVVKPNEVYWFFAGITMAVLSLNKVSANINGS